MSKNNPPIIVEQPTIAEQLLVSVKKIAEAFDEIRITGIPRPLIVTLIKDKTKLAKRDILKVFEAVDELVDELNRKTK